jgi:hypothetical protein
MVTAKSHRRVVTGHRGGKLVVLSDRRREPYEFKTVVGLEHTYMWSTNGTVESAPTRSSRNSRNLLFLLLTAPFSKS